MSSKLLFGDCAELRSEKINPKSSQNSYYVGLEHIEQQTLSLVGHGYGSDVDSQKQKFYEGDILFGKLRPYFRKVIIAPFEGICSTDIWVVKPRAGVDRNFLFYWMASEEFISSSTFASEGGRMPRAKWDWVCKFELQHFTFREQVAIGNILRVFDQKIAINKALSKTLEDIAQTIFKSWFIDFDPVKAKMAGEKPVGMDAATAALFPDSMVDSEFGLIPKGWTVSNLDSIASVKYGAPFASKLFNTTKVGQPLIRIRDLQKQSISTWSTENHPKGFMVTGGELLIGMDGEFNPTIWFGEDALVNQRICKIEPKDFVSNFFLYFMLVPIMRKIEHGSTGSTVIHLGKTDIDGINICVPSVEILAAFKSLVETLLKQMV